MSSSSNAAPSGGAAATAATAATLEPSRILSGVSMSQLRAMANDHDDNADTNATANAGDKAKKPTSGGGHSRVSHVRNNSAISREDVLHFVHRLAIFGAALFYVVSCFQAIPDTVKLLQAIDNTAVLEPPTESTVMRAFIGTTTIRASPLVVTALGNTTAPRRGTLYLTATDAATGYSFTPCTGVDPASARLYNDATLRMLYSTFVSSLAYNLTTFAPNVTELIAPVVDCTISSVQTGDTTFIRPYYLIRSLQDVDTVYMIPVRMAAMEYKLPDQAESGPAGVATVAFIDDLRATWVRHSTVVTIGFPFEKIDFRVYKFSGLTDEGAWSLTTIPKYPDRELSKRLFVSSKTGSFIKAESEQSNVNNAIWVLNPTSPIKTLVEMQFTSMAVLRDSWAWVHLVEFYLGFDVLVNLFILLIVSMHNLRLGTLWMGDSFVAVSSTLLFRGTVVLLSLYVDKFWSLTEFCTYDASYLSENPTLTIYESITHADLLSLYLSFAGVLGMVFRERVDPLVAIVCFEIGYRNRRNVLAWFPPLYNTAIEFSDAIYASSTQAAMDGQSNITPMQFRTTFATTSSATTIFTVLVAIPLTFGLIVVYIAASKVYRYFYPDKLVVLRSKNTSNTHQSENEEALLAQKRQFTLFEVATGAQLENRFGLLSRYITCVFVRGTKFASADGIYSNGFVIANGKFLVQARDVFWVVLMKLTRSRFTNVYVYELQGNSVQQKARLVYPETFTWKDVFFINITILN